MKRLFKSIRSSLVVITLIAGFGFMTNAFAIAPIAMVGSVKGNAFIHHLGKTKKVKVGDHIHNFSEIFTEVGSQVTFSDYYDHQFHLSGSGHVKLNGKTMELKGGYLWLQSFNREESFAVETANAHVNYMYGESVISFDAYSGKSQLMTISGGWDFSNKFEKYRTTRLQDGQFSFISKDYENGSPRQPTPIGQGSYKKVVSLFGGVKTLDQQASRDFQINGVAAAPTSKKTSTPPMIKTRARGIASHVEGDQFPAKTDSAALIREIAAGGKDYDEPKVATTYKPKKKVSTWTGLSKSEKDSFMNYYNYRLNKMKPKKKVSKNKVDYTKKSGAKVYVFGADWAPVAHKEKGDIRIYNKKRFEAAQKTVQAPKKIAPKKRAPASLPKKAIEAPKDVFESTLRREYKKQTRHTSEVNDLINELESYDQDYQRSY